MRKIYVLLLVTAVIIVSANAQSFQKGDKLLGGSIGYTIQRSTYSNPVSTNPTQNSDYRYYSLSVSPSLGFFTKPNRLSGFSLLFNYGSSIPGNIDNKQKSYTYGVGFYKQYWNSLGKNFYFNIQGRTGANYGKNEYIYPSQRDETKYATAYLSIEPGFAYRMKKRLVLDAYYAGFLSAAYTYSERRGNNGLFSREYTVSAITGLQNFSLNNIILGFRYLL